MENHFQVEKKLSLRLGQSGFSLVEMVVVTAVFVIVIIVATEAFNRIYSRSTALSKSEESNIEGVVALEMFRKDLVQAGFGLPWDFDGTAPTYTEATGDPAKDFNDSGTTTGIPRAFVAGNDLDGTTKGVVDKTDYLALKGSPLSLNAAAGKWTHVDTTGIPKQWSEDSLNTGDRVVVMKREFTDSGYKSTLIHTGNTIFTTYKPAGLDAAFQPQLSGDKYYLYGISSDQDPTMPFNRSDYYVKRLTTIPASCADNTGVLYKAVVNQSNGATTPIPIMDCVADMQVVFGWDMNDDGVVDTYSDAVFTGTPSISGTATASDVEAVMADPVEFRKKLKLVKVYLMVQDGKKDRSYRNSQKIIVGNLGEETLTKSYSVSKLDDNNWTNYRWKIYRIVVTPKNLKAE